MPDNLSLIELETPEDDLLLPWFDLYETAFPPEEQMRVSDILDVLKKHKNGIPTDGHIAAIVDDAGEFQGLVWYEIDSEGGFALLWYLAVVEEARSKGVGAWAYNEIARIAKERGVNALVLEVEMPEAAHTDEERTLRQRRIEFYRRNGARLLHGVYYTVGMCPFLPPIPMNIMFHPFTDLAPEDAFLAAKDVLGETVTITGELALE
jgi:GNAT superfamily N-acetyltransferase